jgi:plasmid replication initiation protein
MPKFKLITYNGDAPVTELNVNMSNALVRAAHGLSLAEKRVVSICMAKLDSIRQKSDGYLFKLTAQEFAETFEVDANTAYEQMKFAGDNLMKRVARTVETGPRGKIERKWVWVSAVTYHHGEGRIELEFSRRMTPHLMLLRKEFTSYKLKQASALRSIYSWRLFELLMQFKSTGILHIDIDEFCHAVEAPETYRANFKDLRKRIIEPAVAELMKKDGMQIEWTAKKPGGRKITSLEFKFSKQAETETKADAKPTKKARKRIGGVAVAEIEKQANPGESYEAAAARIGKQRKSKTSA